MTKFDIFTKIWYNKNVKWRKVEPYFGGGTLANSILQLNWSEYIERIRQGQFPNNTLIYIQDKGFYIQTSDNLSRTAVTQYFVVYGNNVNDILVEKNGLPGLYVLVKGTTSASLYYHDGQTAWVQVSGTGGGGNVGAIKINGDTYTANTEGVIDISDKIFAQLYKTNDAAKKAAEEDKEKGATGYIAGIVDGGGW